MVVSVSRLVYKCITISKNSLDVLIFKHSMTETFFITVIGVNFISIEKIYLSSAY